MRRYLFVSVLLYSLSFPSFAQNGILVKDLEIKPELGGYLYGLAVDQKGNIYVSDVLTYNIKFYSPDGALVELIGRKGKGPGEFLNPKSLGIINNQLYVFDNKLLRISIFKLGKRVELKKTINLSLPETSKDNYITPNSILFESSKRFYGIYSNGYSQRNLSEKHLATLKIINEEGKIVNDSVLTVPDQQFLVTRSGGGFMVGPLPFGRKPIFVKGKQGSFYYGNTNKLEIKQYSKKGTIKSKYTAKPNRINVTKKDLKDEIIRSHASPSQVQRASSENVPKTFPAFSWFVVDDQARVWVAVNTKDRENYSLFIFKNDRDLWQKTKIPKSVELKAIKNGYAYGIKKGKKEIQYVVRYKVKGLN